MKHISSAIILITAKHDLNYFITIKNNNSIRYINIIFPFLYILLVSTFILLVKINFY